MSDAAERWRDAVLAAAALCADPVGLGGAVVRARAGPVRDAWLGLVTRWAGPLGPVRRVPPGIADDRLLGGLDLAATLSAGRPVAARGLLAEADGGLLILPMGERATAALCGRLALAMDGGAEGARFGLLVLDEGAEPDEGVAAALSDRLALHLDLDGLAVADAVVPEKLEPLFRQARRLVASVAIGRQAAAAVTETAAALGINSLRAPLMTLRLARVIAALNGRGKAGEDDIADAARLVLAPRARTVPMPPESEEAPEEPPPPEDRAEDAGRDREQGTLEDRVLDAVRAALPEDVSGASAATRRRGAEAAGAGARAPATRGRPQGTRRAQPDGRYRLDLVATLRAAAPWQPLRRRNVAGKGHGVVVLAEDFRVRRFVRPAESVTIFLVDASGSAAAARLAEAKGAVELMLSRAYRRREKVALIAFRGAGAELLLPPTRSLVQAKRRLAVLPGGGGTPLAAGLLAAAALAQQVRRRGATPFLAVLTDGRGNIALDGSPGRSQAAEDALQVARRIAAEGMETVLIDTGNRPQAAAEALSSALGARYLPLPRADAAAMSRMVGQAAR